MVPTEPGAVEGSPYVSLRFGERCREIGASIARSAPRATASTTPSPKSFFATLENDLLRRRSFTTRQEARTTVFDDMEAFYNPVPTVSTETGAVHGCHSRALSARVIEEDTPGHRRIAAGSTHSIPPDLTPDMGRMAYLPHRLANGLG